ncbi:MAG: tetratricopeptide repeat protein [Planctomycetota bacterium]|nr:MAG: tetratricopeptide repeat protein [Planctomycetota bacterium]
MRYSPAQTGPLAWFTVAVACMAVGGATAQTPAATQAVGAQTKASTSDDALIRRARAALDDGRAAEAVEMLRDVRRRRPQDTECTCLLARAYVGIGAGERGVQLLSGALRENPHEPALWVAKAECLLATDRPASALACVDAARDAVGAQADLDWCAAQALFELGELLGDVEVRTVAQGSAGKFVGDWYLVEPRGSDRFLCCPPRSALYQLRRALDAGVDDPRAHLLHAEIWWRIGRPRRAWAVLERMPPEVLDAAAPDELADCQKIALAAGRIEAYLRFARRRARRVGEAGDAVLSEAFHNAAAYFNRQGDPQLYRAFLARAIARTPDDVRLKYEYAEALWEAGQRDEAARWYRRVLEQSPDHPQAVRILDRLLEYESQAP